MAALKPESLVAVPLPNGSYCVLWILEASLFEGKGYFRFVIMEGFHAVIPGQEQLGALVVAGEPGGGVSYRANIWKGSFIGDVPSDFAVVGQRTLPKEPDHPFFAFQGTMVFQDGENCRTTLFRQWRLVHDRPAVEAEWARAAAERQQRLEERQRTLTLPKMLKEPAFANWAGRWPQRAVREARRIFRDATRELIALQDKGTKRQRIAVLKRIVTELNALDDKEGCIETVEREQIVARIEALAGLVGISNEDETLTGHRDW